MAIVHFQIIIWRSLGTCRNINELYASSIAIEDKSFELTTGLETWFLFQYLGNNLMQCKIKPLHRYSNFITIQSSINFLSNFYEILKALTDISANASTNFAFPSNSKGELIAYFFADTWNVRSETWILLLQIRQLLKMLDISYWKMAARSPKISFDLFTFVRNKIVFFFGNKISGSLFET